MPIGPTVLKKELKLTSGQAFVSKQWSGALSIVEVEFIACIAAV